MKYLLTSDWSLLLPSTDLFYHEERAKTNEDLLMSALRGNYLKIAHFNKVDDRRGSKKGLYIEFDSSIVFKIRINA